MEPIINATIIITTLFSLFMLGIAVFFLMCLVAELISEQIFVYVINGAILFFIVCNASSIWLYSKKFGHLVGSRLQDLFMNILA